MPARNLPVTVTKTALKKEKWCCTPWHLLSRHLWTMVCCPASVHCQSNWRHTPTLVQNLQSFSLTQGHVYTHYIVCNMRQKKNVPALPFSVPERVNKHAHCISWKWIALFHSLTCLGRYVCCVRFVVLSFFMPLKCLGRVILSTNMCAVENCGSISRVMRRHSCVQLEKGALLRMVYTADWRTSAKCLAPSSIFDKNELLSLYPLQP